MSVYDGGKFFDSGITYDSLLVPKGKNMSAKVALNIAKLLTSEFAAKYQVGIDGLTTNAATYTTPNPTLVVAQGDVDGLTDILADINNKEQELNQLRMQRDQLRLDAELNYALLAAYVQNKSGGDPAKILLAGFDVAGTTSPSPVQPMVQVQGVSLVGGMDESGATGYWD